MCAFLCVRACVCPSFSLSPSLSFSLFEMQHLQMCLVNCSSQLLSRSEGGIAGTEQLKVTAAGRGGGGHVGDHRRARVRLTAEVRGRRQPVDAPADLRLEDGEAEV